MMPTTATPHQRQITRREIVVTGGSGFIGRHLIPTLVADGYAVTVLTRARSVPCPSPTGLLRYVHWDFLLPDGQLDDLLADTDAVINLAGTNIGSRRWTTKRRADLLDSRVRITEALVQAIARLDLGRRPQTLVNASGIDFYGDRSDETLTEDSAPGDTFLARLCQCWEHTATTAQALGVRVVLMRTAVILAHDAFTLHLLAWPFRFKPGTFSDSTTACPVSKTGNWQDVGHYTWVIWGDTTSVGCGFASDGTNDYLVCRYSPGGNVSAYTQEYDLGLEMAPFERVRLGHTSSLLIF